ncbi:hypothetical protein FAM22278_02841 [Lacticaseibacillus paracasei]|nr:hypothetical protein FAM22278_02841 [Lacticaseibacillus paracasei]
MLALSFLCKAVATTQQAEVKYTTIGGAGTTGNSGAGQQVTTPGTGIDQTTKDNEAALKAAAEAKAKAEAEAKLTALLNTENAQTLADLQASGQLHKLPLMQPKPRLTRPRQNCQRPKLQWLKRKLLLTQQMQL